MAKNPTYPILFDECKPLYIADLKRLGYLNPNSYCSGIIHWTTNGEPTGSVSIKVNTASEPYYIELNYSVNSKPIKYRIRLVTLPSNLGKGVIWAFICPKTGKRTRKLYLVGDYFLHREAFQGCMYSIQTKSKRERKLSKFFDTLKTAEQLESRYFKKYYNDKPTKRYLSLLRQYEKGLSISVSELF